MTQPEDSLKVFVGVGFIHPAIVLFAISTPANKKLDAALDVGSFVEHRRNFEEFTHLVSVTDAV